MMMIICVCVCVWVDVKNYPYFRYNIFIIVTMHFAYVCL